VDIRLVERYLSRIGVPQQIIAFFLEQMDGATMKVRSAFGDTKAIRVKRGTRQGAIESPLLFICMLDPLLHVLKSSTRGTLALANGYADDLLLAHTDKLAALQSLATVREFAQLIGTSVSQRKSWWLPVGPVEIPVEGTESRC
jgi:hypothetical protein